MKKFLFLIMVAGLLNAQVLKLNNNTVTVDASGNIKAGTNYTLEGYTTGKNVYRLTGLILQPGATPGTNIDITQAVDTGSSFNKPTFTNADDLAKDGTDGNFTLASDGTYITMDLTEDVIGIAGFTVTCHDLNSSSTTEVYFPYATAGGSNLIIKIRKRGSTTDVDWTSILDAGDYFTFTIAYITST